LEFSRHIERVDLEKGQLESQMGLELLESLK